MKKRWKAAVSWLLIIAMLGGYGDTALAAGTGYGVPQNPEQQTLTGDAQEEQTQGGTDETDGKGGEENGSPEESQEEAQEDAELTEAADGEEQILTDSVEIQNPFDAFLEHQEEEAPALYSNETYVDSFGSQIEDELAKEIYARMVDKYVTRREMGDVGSLDVDKVPTEIGSTQSEAATKLQNKLMNSLNVAAAAFLMDYPSVFWIKSSGLSWRYSLYQDTQNTDEPYYCKVTVLNMTVNTTYNIGVSAQMVSDFDQAIEQAKQQIRAAAGDHADHYELVAAIHDYLCDKLSYDTQAANGLGSDAYDYAHVASTVFLGHDGNYKVVCEGYAKAFKVLCDEFDIPCALVIGTGKSGGSSGPHMWNYVRMEDGGWYGMDVTWDDSIVSRDYFLSGSETEGAWYGSTFSGEHIESMQILTSSAAPFVYPVLETERYTVDSGYKGTVYTDANGESELWISDVEAGQNVEESRILRLLQKNYKNANLAAVHIVRAQENGSLNKTISGEVTAAAAGALKADGTLYVELWNRSADTASTGASETEVTEWSFTGLKTTDSATATELDGTVSFRAQSGTGRYEISLEAAAAEKLAAETAVFYSSAEVGAAYQAALEEFQADDAAVKSMPVVWYQTTDGKLQQTAESEYRCTGDSTFGERHGLYLDKLTGISDGAVYTLVTQKFYKGTETGSTLLISEKEAERKLSTEELTSILERYAQKNDTEVEILLTDEYGDLDTQISKAVLNQAKAALAENGTLKLDFWAEGRDELTRWELHSLKNAETDFDAAVSGGQDGTDWILSLADTAVPAESARVSWSVPELADSYTGTDETLYYYYLDENEETQYAEAAGSLTQTSDSLFGERYALQAEQVESWKAGQSYRTTESRIVYGWQQNAAGRWLYRESRSGEFLTGWQQVEGRNCWFDENGILAEGAAQIADTWYLFGSYEKGNQGLLTGYQQVDGSRYDADANGILQTGWENVSEGAVAQWRYFSKTEESYGKELDSVYEGDYWYTADGHRYYLKNNKTLLKGWQTIDGKKYYFTEEGYALTGWYPDSSAKNAYYLDEVSGEMLTGYQQIDGEHYYFNTKGIRQYGWIQVKEKNGNRWRYFEADAESGTYGQEKTGENLSDYWYEADGKKYYITGNSTVAKGWKNITTAGLTFRYYFGTNGEMYTGTQKIGKYLYHFHTMQGKEGVLGTGLFTDEGKTYYAGSSGILQTGWQKINGSWRYFNSITGAESTDIVLKTNYWASAEGNTYYFKNGTTIAKGWLTLEGRRYYFDAFGILQTGFFKVGKNTYYGLPEGETYPGALVSGEQTIDGNEYYFNSSWVLQTGFQKINGSWSYFSMAADSPERGKKLDASDVTADGNYYWYNIEGEKYCLKKNTTLLTGWQTIDKKRYYFDKTTGAMTKAAALTISGSTYYFGTDGVMCTGCIVDGYGYNTKGQRVKGWQTISGNRYYFDTKTYQLQTGDESGLYQLGTKTYYLGTDGVLRYGWIEADGKNYYADKNGVLVSSWQKIDNDWYYFDKNTKVQDGAAYIGDDWFAYAKESGQSNTYYFAKGKTLAKGWQTIGGFKYYFDASGVMQTQKVKIGSSWYYFGTDGKMRTGFQKYCGSTYYFAKNGKMVTGSQKINGEKYYFGKDGTLQPEPVVKLTGWKTVGGKRYYYLDGEVQTGWITVAGVLYYLNEDGTPHQGFLELENHVYYTDAKGKILTGWQTLKRDGVKGKYYFDRGNGAAWMGAKQISGKWYYFDPQKMGEMAVNETITDADGNSCYYTANGTRQSGWKKIDGVWRYFASDNGRECVVTEEGGGWVTVAFSDGTTEKAYIKKNNTVLNGWQTVDGLRYYFDQDGFQWTAEKGWLTIGNSRYRFDAEKNDSVYQGFLKQTDAAGAEQSYLMDSKGKMLTGWQTVKQGENAGTYYFDPIRGTAYTGHRQIGANWYYFDAEGRRQTGYIEDADGTWYYFNTKGVAQTGWKKVPGTEGWKFFDPESEIPGAEQEYSRTEQTAGKTVYVWYQVDTVRYCFKNDTTLLKNKQKIDGKTYWFHKTTGVLYTGFFTIGQDHYLSNEDGTVYTGFGPAEKQSTENDAYYNADGKRVTGWVTIKTGEHPGKYYFNKLTGTCYRGGWYTIDGTGYLFDEYGCLQENEKTATSSSAKLKELKLTENGVAIQFTVNGRLKSYNDEYYLVRIDTYSNSILSKQPVYTFAKDDGTEENGKYSFSVEIPLPEEYKNDTDSSAQFIMSKYELAVKSSETKFARISNRKYVSNPEYAAANQQPYFMPDSKKGIQSTRWAVDSGTKNTIVNLKLSSVVKDKEVKYTYKGKNYYFSDMSTLRRTIREYNRGIEVDEHNGEVKRNKIQVSLIILLDGSGYTWDMVAPAARSGGYKYYMLNTESAAAQQKLEAVFSYLGEIFGQEDCFVSNWILGNEVDSCNAWNYNGGMGFDQYIRGYTQAFRILYYAVKKSCASSRVFISLDNAWNQPVAGYSSRAVLDAFARQIHDEAPDVDWNVAFHPYSQPLSRTEFWKDGSNTTNSTGTSFLSMQNLSVLTGYLASMEKTYGKDKGSIRVILSEQGWSSAGYGEDTQAEAIARAYYIAEFNNRVDAFIIRAEIDDQEEMYWNGLYLGLKNSNETKKIAYFVYKYMDTPRETNTDETWGKWQLAMKDYNTSDLWDSKAANKKKYETARSILMNTNWKSILSSYGETFDKEKLNNMPYARSEFWP